MNRSELPLFTKERTVNYKQLGFVRSVFPVYKNVSSDARNPERGEHVMVAATGSGEVEAAERLRPEQN